jgi:hypothetical protein
VEPATLPANGIDVEAVQALVWSPTHLLFNDPAAGEPLEFPVTLKDLDERHELAKFVIRP